MHVRKPYPVVGVHVELCPVLVLVRVIVPTSAPDAVNAPAWVKVWA
ncbi:hypothetical protein WMF38_26970 [Sorangium sp. So ce118]